MPEYIEVYGFYQVIQVFISHCTSSSLSTTVRAILIDATDYESARLDANSRAKAELPFSLGPKDDVLRGPSSGQNRLYPPLDEPLRTAKMCLVETVFHPRNVILRFVLGNGKDLWMQVQPLTHTMVQILSKPEWDEHVACVPKRDRKFKVGVALAFDDYVMLFATYDMVFKVSYAAAPEELPARLHTDIYDNFETALQNIIDWMTERKAKSSRKGLATVAIRQASDTFPGFGVYSVHEALLHRAGVPSDITEEELFSTPSRTARFIEAMYSHGDFARTTVWPFTRKYMRKPSFVLAVKDSQRNDYSAHLFVHGQDVLSVSERWAVQSELRQKALQADDAVEEHASTHGPRFSGICDVFEPTLIKAGLEKQHNLGDLIFGGCDAWRRLGGMVWENNPLRQYFAREKQSTVFGYFSQGGRHRIPVIDCGPSTFLTPEIRAADPLFLSRKDLRRKQVRTIMVLVRNGKPAWSGIPVKLPLQKLEKRKKKKKKTALSERMSVDTSVDEVSDNLEPDPDAASDQQPFLQIALPAVRESKLLRTLMRTETHGVGPLDFCGSAKFHSGRILISHNSPNVSRWHHARYVQGHNRWKQGPLTGKRKVALEGDRAANKYSKCPSGSDEAPPPKRRRLNADTQLMLTNSNHMVTGARRK